MQSFKQILARLNTKEIRYHVLALVILIVLDQISKIWAQYYLEATDTTIAIYLPYFQLSYLRNYLPGWYSYVFYLAFNLVFLPWMWFYYLTHPESPQTLKIGLTMIYAGLIGNNLIDAFWFGYIRDFIYLINFGTGNVADQIKYVGVILTVFGALQMEGYLKSTRQALIILAVIIVIFLLIMRYFYGIIQI